MTAVPHWDVVGPVDTDADLAKRMLETGSPVYQRAFGKKMMDRPLNDAETRALSTTTTAG